MFNRKLNNRITELSEKLDRLSRKWEYRDREDFYFYDWDGPHLPLLSGQKIIDRFTEIYDHLKVERETSPEHSFLKKKAQASTK